MNRKFFYDYIRQHLFSGRITKKQMEGLDAILTKWLTFYSDHDDRWFAYIMATAYHETNKTIQPIEEYGKGKGKPYGIVDPITKKKYFGRGHIQLTWKGNYEFMGKLLKIDLINNPDLALQPSISIGILFYGMIGGYFTGKKLSEYFNDKKEDWFNVRRIVNGTDKAELIAGYAKQFYAAISYTK